MRARRLSHRLFQPLKAEWSSRYVAHLAEPPARHQRAAGANAARAGHPLGFTDAELLPQRPTEPKSGWRRVVLRLSGGRLNLGPSPGEQAQAELLERVRAPIAGCRRIAVLSRKGGVGKTTITLALGHTFATLRSDRILALDANPDAGTLGYRLDAQGGRTLTDLLADADRVVRYSDARSYTAQSPSRLEVMASDDDPRITAGFGAAEYATAVDVLERHYNLLLTDTGTDMTHSVMTGVLAAADQIVLVLAPGLDGARAASRTLDWLTEHGHADLVAGAVAVLNGVDRRSLIDLEQVRAHFAGRCREVVTIPWDHHLKAGAQTSLDDLAEATRQAYTRLAAAVADGFPR